MHETMRSLRSLEGHQSDRTASASPLSHDALRNLTHERKDVDARIHEYEQQIAELYEENQQEKLKNEMLSECLRDQKHAKAKLMKACKHVKQELQAVKDSGLSQMLVDIETRCDDLEKEKAQVMEELLAERSLRAEQETKQKSISKQLDDLILESTKWEDIVSRKDKKLQLSRDQICEQQLAIENLKADLKIKERRVNRPQELSGEEEEIKQLRSTINVFRSKVGEFQNELQQLKTENEFLREQLTSQHGARGLEDEDSSCAAQETYKKLLIQVRLIKRKILALKELVQTYEDTNTVNINLLDGGSSFYEECVDDDTLASHSCERKLMHLSGSVLEVARYLSELQEVVEDACARLIGSTCALQ
ncbi:hypothetical protein V7S43_006969 [Phytophthora oleae]|uniref:Uncharacterized protein n=1 Tax=Phytophthora oleae TaxID=2107226 RepID=A0ABD3FQS5_9STRA